MTYIKKNQNVILKVVQKTIGLFFCIFGLSHGFAFAEEANYLPETIAELDMLIGEGNQYKSALWSPRAEIMVDLESVPSQIRTRDRKSKHFFYINNFCQIYTEVFDQPDNIIIPKGIRYLFREMKITENMSSDLGLVTEIFIKISDRAEAINSLDIICTFPSDYVNSNSNPSLLFKEGLEDTILFLPSILF